MMLPLAFLIQAQMPQPPRPPQRTVAKPGVIATDQRVTPAGVQSVFEGRIGGVRFGADPRELWIAAPGAAYRIDWQSNRVLASAAFDGRPGVQGVALDPATGRVLVSSVGKLPAAVVASRMPGAPPPRAESFAQVMAFDRSVVVTRPRAGGDSAAVMFSSDGLGAYMAGGLAVAKRMNNSGHRVAVVPLPANDRIAILDADDGALMSTIALGVLPVSAAISDDGSIAWITNFGGPKPASGARAATQCCDPQVEPVRVDARGIAEAGSVTRVDLVAGTVAAVVTVGLHPTGVAWDQLRGRLYVANGNSDAITIVDTRTNAVAGTIGIAPFRERKAGLAPTAVALSPDGGALYVTLGGANAVAVYDVSPKPASPALRGLIPTGWYPSSIDVSADGRTLAVGTLLGVGSGIGTTSGHPGKTAGFVHAVRGSVNVIAVPTDAELTAYTTSVAQNNRFTLRGGADAPSLALPRATAAARAVPERPGEKSLIDHAVFIIRENRTYDQVLGDIGKGASDSSLAMYGRDVTPNAHALAEQFVLLDHFFASGGNSADGHQWLTQANETDYPMWPLYFGRSYPFEGSDPLVYSSGGFLWEAAQAAGKSVSVFGEYASVPAKAVPSAVRMRQLEEYRDRQTHTAAFFRTELAAMYNTHSEIPSLDKVLVRDYPGWTLGIPDVVKAEDLLDHLREWQQAGEMPNLTMMILPGDHTSGTTAGWCQPKACVADNDLALGRIVEGLTHSLFWKSMAILVVEDDAQNGVDHIDGHRTVALVASPFAKHGEIDSTFYSQPSMVKTIELMLGLPALSMFDLVATDMRASFLPQAGKPDLAAFTAIEPRQSLYDVNVRVGSITGPHAAERRAAAIASAKMDFDEPDEAPSDQLNHILWHDARGWTAPYPAAKHSLFFPLSIDLSDDERQEKKGKKDEKEKP
jgi:YVTN family beta-propeller protein